MKTDLSKVFSISGEQGLFTYVAKATRGVILESMITKKRMCAGPDAKMSALSDISIFTKDDEVKLQAVFEKMKKELADKEAPAGKSDSKVLKAFFDKAFPEYDADRFYVSHMKKVVEWYNALKKFASLDFEAAEKEEAESKAAKAGAGESKKSSAKSAEAKQGKGAKGASKAAAPAKSNVPRKVIA